MLLVDRDEAALTRLCAELGDKALPVVVDLLSPASITTMMPQILAPGWTIWMSFTPMPGPMSGAKIWLDDPDVLDRMLHLTINTVFRLHHHCPASGSAARHPRGQSLTPSCPPALISDRLLKNTGSIKFFLQG